MAAAYPNALAAYRSAQANLAAFLALADKPSYTAPNGQSFSWDEHRTNLAAAAKAAGDELQRASVADDGPIEVWN